MAMMLNDEMKLTLCTPSFTLFPQTQGSQSGFPIIYNVQCISVYPVYISIQALVYPSYSLLL